MVFNSFSFLFFFAIVLGLYQLKWSWRARKIMLLGASYWFYAAFNPPFVLVLWASTVVDWYVAGRMSREENARRRHWLWLSLLANLGLLSFFKYGTFLLANWTALMAVIGIKFVPLNWNIVLPAGISFYTFQSLSYTIDVFRREIRRPPGFLDFALFVSFFPQLVAGPIVRATDFLPQLDEPKQASGAQFGWGLVLVVIGLFQKITLADAVLAPVANQVYNSALIARTYDTWIGTVAFAGQILFDFSGYSHCAIGIAMCFGFILPDNFRCPYAACGFSDFWRRWHISLSSWLRDYLYIPLGGNRKGTIRTISNLMMTMLLGGLWHGASWRFLAWGGIHGFYLVLERGAQAWAKKIGYKPGRKMLALFIVLTFPLICVTWVFFRASTFRQAYHMVVSMAFTSLGPMRSDPAMARTAMLVMAGALVLQWCMRSTTIEAVWNRAPMAVRSVWLSGMIFLIATVPVQEQPFIYFQF